MKEGTSSSKQHVSVVGYSLSAFLPLLCINSNKSLPFFRLNHHSARSNSCYLYFGLGETGLFYIPVIKVRALFLCGVCFI